MDFDPLHVLPFTAVTLVLLFLEETFVLIIGAPGDLRAAARAWPPGGPRVTLITLAAGLCRVGFS